MTVETRDGDVPSFTDPSVEFRIVTSGNNKPTGEIECIECNGTGNGLPGIDHEPGCSQADVR